MQELFEILHNLLVSGQDALLVSILAESGSAPRGAGAHMLVGANGRLCGSIGGGNMEHQSEKLAKDLLQQRRSLLQEYHLSHDLGMICGGEATVFYQFIAAENTDMRALTDSALRLIKADKDLWLIIRLKEGAEWQMGLYSREEGLQFLSLDMEVLQPCLKCEPKSYRLDGADYFVERIHYAARVLIFGGGHVAQALVPLLAKLGFSCWVMDDRPQFATAGLFPEARRAICGSYEDIAEHIEIRPSDFVVVMTHGHSADYLVQKQAMQASPAYIGVIGSKNKVNTISEWLTAEGFTPTEITRVHAPIGLPIGAKTPAEIAVSIAGQLIQVRADLTNQ